MAITTIVDNGVLFSGFGVFRVSRSNIDFLRIQNLAEKPDEVLALAVPFGDPNVEAVKFTKIGNSYYLTYIIFQMDQDSGYGLILRIGSSQINKLKNEQLLAGMKSFLGNKDNLDPLKKESGVRIPIEPVQKLMKLENVPHLDGIIYTVLIQAKLFIFGSHEELIHRYRFFQEYFPEGITKHLTFVSQSNSMNENVSVIGLPSKDEYLKAVQEQTNKIFSVWHLERNKVFAPFTSNTCRRLADLLEKDKLSIFKAEFGAFIQLITENSHLQTIDEIIEELKLDFDDAQLMLAVNKALAGGKVEMDQIS